MKFLRSFCALGMLLTIHSSLHAQLQYTHFTLETLAPGVYAAINKLDGYAICNAGIVDLGDETLVFDTFLSLEAAAELKRAAEQLTGKTVRHVVNSHHHNDHIRGNQLFTGATIYSTPLARELMLQEEPNNVISEKEEAPKAIEALQAAALHVKDSTELLEIQLGIRYNQAIYNSLEEYRLTPPNRFISDSLVMHGPLNRAILITWGGGHTASDLFLWLPERKILFAGDLVFNGFHPWLPDGSIDALNEYLKKLQSLGVEIIVPGHGRIGGPALLDRMLRYTSEIRSQMITARQRDFKESDYAALHPSDEFSNWLLRSFYVLNIKLGQ
jgi:cyclase